MNVFLRFKSPEKMLRGIRGDGGEGGDGGVSNPPRRCSGEYTKEPFLKGYNSFKTPEKMLRGIH